MKFTFPVGGLKARGYTFQKLYARDYKTYRKEVTPCYTIWLWVLDRQLEVNDWHGNTDKVIEFFLTNIDHPDYDKTDSWGEKRDYIKVQLNSQTGHVQMYDYEEYSKIFKAYSKNPETAWNAWEAKYSNYREVILRKSELLKLVKEIKILTK